MHELIRLIKQRKFKALFMEKNDDSFVQFFRYLFVGGLASVVDWTALWFFYDIVNIYKYISIALAFACGLLVNYIFSSLFVFTDVETGSRTSQFTIYLTTGLMGLGWTELFMLLFDEVLGIHYMVSKIITTAIVLLWNFGSKKILLYRKRGNK